MRVFFIHIFLWAVSLLIAGIHGLAAQTVVNLPYVVDGTRYTGKVEVFFSLRECNEVTPKVMNNLDGNIVWDVDKINFPCVNFEIKNLQWEKPEHAQVQLRVTLTPPSQRSGLRGITQLTQIVNAGEDKNIRLTVTDNSARRPSFTITFTPIVITDPRQNQVVLDQRYRIVNYTFPTEVPAFQPGDDKKESEEKNEIKEEVKSEELAETTETSGAGSDETAARTNDQTREQRRVSQSDHTGTEAAITEQSLPGPLPHRVEYSVTRSDDNTFRVEFEDLNQPFRLRLLNEDENEFYLVSSTSNSFAVFVGNEVRNYAQLWFEGYTDTLRIPFFRGSEAFEAAMEIDRKFLTLNISGGEGPYLVRFLREGLQFPLYEMELPRAGEHQINIRNLRNHVTGTVNIQVLDAQRMNTEMYRDVAIPGGLLNARAIFVIVLLLIIGGVAVKLWLDRREKQAEQHATKQYDIDLAKDRMRRSIRRNTKTS